jgi:hypothetical protein
MTLHKNTEYLLGVIEYFMSNLVNVKEIFSFNIMEEKNPYFQIIDPFLPYLMFRFAPLITKKSKKFNKNFLISFLEALHKIPHKLNLHK